MVDGKDLPPQTNQNSHSIYLKQFKEYKEESFRGVSPNLKIWRKDEPWSRQLHYVQVSDQHHKLVFSKYRLMQAKV